jgi:N-acetylglucosamine-6-phosphate deacetylase
LLLCADAVWTPERALPGGWLAVEGERITALGAGPPPGRGALDLRGLTLCPGFVDLHIHGSCGADVMSGGVEAVSAWLPRHGCTTYLPTTVTAPWEETLAAVAALAAAVADPPPGARPAGIHLEGPFLNPLRRGMQPAGPMRAPDSASVERLLGAGGGHVRWITLAPELEGGLEAVRALAARGVGVALAHSDATFEQAEAAAAAGARHVTHCFNAMRPLHHRDPGLAGAALALPGLSAEVIADGVHVHPAMLRVLWRARGWRRLCLVTDAMAGAGAPEGRYRFGGQDVTVRGGEARLPDGTLAGSVLTMDRAVATMVRAGVPPRQAVAMASRTPAAVAGLRDAGRLAPGRRADIVGLRPDLGVAWVMIAGRVAWRA